MVLHSEGETTMKCYSCNTELIWGGDHDTEEEDEHLIETNLSCPNKDCGAFVLVFHGKRDG
jgi:hypothetical protein